MNSVMEIIQNVSDLVWGLPLMVLLVGTGLYLTFVLRGLQFRRLWHSLYLGLIKRKEAGDEPGDISHFQALMTALSATVGTGNIAGVATAVVAGGPGALFWMWITGLVGMATKYAEAVLAVKYRKVDEDGTMSGGPMYYLTHGLNARWLGVLFAVFASVAAFGIGNMVQSNSVADAIEHNFGIPSLYTGVILMALTLLVIIGGIKNIGRVTGILVPVMILFYFTSALIILIVNIQNIPHVLSLVFAGAFSGQAATGGFLGATVMMAMRNGVARGVFSNESGLGSSPIAAAAAKTKHPVTQALVSMTQTFIDTIVVCSLTGFAIILSGLWMSEANLNGAQLTSEAFHILLPGNLGGYIVSIGLVLFAYSTILGWSYYGEKSIEFLFEIGRKTRLTITILLLLVLASPLFILRQSEHYSTLILLALLLVYGLLVWKIGRGGFLLNEKRIVTLYRGTFGVYVLVGALSQLDIVWGLADVFNGLMAFPNLIGLLGLSGIIVKVTRDYFAE